MMPGATKLKNVRICSGDYREHAAAQNGSRELIVDDNE